MILFALGSSLPPNTSSPCGHCAAAGLTVTYTLSHDQVLWSDPTYTLSHDQVLWSDPTYTLSHDPVLVRPTPCHMTRSWSDLHPVT
ncbi:unnamed protein product [Arctogadus glacialis]